MSKGVEHMAKHQQTASAFIFPLGHRCVEMFRRTRKYLVKGWAQFSVIESDRRQFCVAHVDDNFGKSDEYTIMHSNIT